MVEALPPSGDSAPRILRPAGRLNRRLAFSTFLVAGLGIAAFVGLQFNGQPLTVASQDGAGTSEVAALDIDVDVDVTPTSTTAQAHGIEPLDQEALAALRGAFGPSEASASDSPSTHFAALESPPASEAPPVGDTSAPPSVEAGPLQTVPLPVARPSEFSGNAGRMSPGRAERFSGRRVRAAAAAPTPPAEDTRSFFDRMFGIEAKPATPAPALAYAALESNPSAVAPPRPSLSPSPAPPRASGGTATYDISARTVTLPSGEKLEAHSGLGQMIDDPRYVHVQMRGATPPGTYDLKEREAAFHGVRAIRLTPVGGPGSVYGRAGLLAHTYMLRSQPGASNGCVVFRNYDRFLQAYLRGEISRLVVVAGNGGSPLPSIFGSFGTSRTARVGTDG